MLKQAKKKLSRFDNVIIKKADITSLKAKDCSFDAVVAGNVIHLLPEPEAALRENFSNRFDEASYKRFFEEMGYDDVTFEIVRGRMSCDIAIINVSK